MTESAIFNGLLYSWFGLSALVFFAVMWITAPYGRHNREGWGIQIPNQLGWVLMELPTVVVFAVLFGISDRYDLLLPIIFFVMWQIHYGYRVFIYPFLTRSRGKQIPLAIAALAFFTNIGIDYLNARWLFTLGPLYTEEWLTDPRFVIGCVLFFTGFTIHVYSDMLLRNLRKPGEHGYKIPTGGLFRWISCPNYFGEIIQWSGWAIATWSLPGLAFAVWTFANLSPRAMSHHRWYHTQFDHYPPKRKALIPFIV